MKLFDTYDSGYDTIAQEYYDARHKTSRNFDQLTKIAMLTRSVVLPNGLVLDVGAGCGRTREYLGVVPERTIQLDNSKVMLSLDDRQPCLLKLQADARAIPISSSQVSVVTAFLADPFMGLQFLAEAFRVLKDGGLIVFTVPTKEWGVPLRQKLKISEETTRFRKIGTEDIVVLPSVLHAASELRAMLAHIGFSNIDIQDHCIPELQTELSDDIVQVCKQEHVDVHKLPIIRSVIARR